MSTLDKLLGVFERNRGKLSINDVHYTVGDVTGRKRHQRMRPRDRINRVGFSSSANRFKFHVAFSGRRPVCNWRLHGN